MKNLISGRSNALLKLRKNFFSELQVKLNPMTCLELDEGKLPKSTTTNKDQLMSYFREMSLMRRMEIESDNLYKNKEIRGFCHLYTGQESVAEGMEAGLTFQDAIITAYREHCQAYKRGIHPKAILAEMMSRSIGATKGKGGSMHYYHKKNNFYGGHGIVGAQIPLGTGIAYGMKYKGHKQACFTMFGDGTCNQGQLFESVNMAALWKLPVVYVIENNHFGMGTSEHRASFFKPLMGKFRGVPGLRIDGMDVFSVREATKFAKDYVINNGPLFLEVDTYRYQGHSMSDPGISYRTRDEVNKIREERDCIERVRRMILENKFAEEKDLKQIEKDLRVEMEEYAEECKKAALPELKELWTEIYANNEEFFHRGVTADLSFVPRK